MSISHTEKYTFKLKVTSNANKNSNNVLISSVTFNRFPSYIRENLADIDPLLNRQRILSYSISFYQNELKSKIDEEVEIEDNSIILSNNNNKLITSLKLSEDVETDYIALNSEQRNNLNVEVGSYVNIIFQNDIQNNQEICETLKVDITSSIKKYGNYYIIINKTSLIDKIKTNFEKANERFKTFTTKSYYNTVETTTSVTCKIIEGAGKINNDTEIIIESSDDTIISDSLTETTSSKFQTINFEELGIGGLDEQFNCIYRRILTSRILPKKMQNELGIKHVKGLLLYGLPGCGKTLMARKISKCLSSKLKIVNGPEIFSKWQGESESNIRDLFKDAKEDYKKQGSEAQLHIIAFDEFDSIAKKRNGGHGNASKDTVVNQLLTMLDGIEEFDNILVIGMTNRKDLIDEALLRPGRFDISLEVGLPDLKGREQILKIHTKNLEKNKCLSGDVDISYISNITKNFTGAELESIVKNAVSHALSKRDLATFKNGKFELNEESDTDELGANKYNFKITMDDFIKAYNEIIPAFGLEENLFKVLNNDIVIYNETFEKNYLNFKYELNRRKNARFLLYGLSGTGKSTLINDVSKNYVFVKSVSSEILITKSSNQAVDYIVDLFKVAKQSIEPSLIILDDLERIIRYSYPGTYDNLILTTLLSYIKIPLNNVTIIASSSLNEDTLKKLELWPLFLHHFKLDKINDEKSFNTIKKHYNFDNTASIKLPMSIKDIVNMFKI